MRLKRSVYTSTRYMYVNRDEQRKFSSVVVDKCNAYHKSLTARDFILEDPLLTPCDLLYCQNMLLICSGTCKHATTCNNT